MSYYYYCYSKNIRKLPIFSPWWSLLFQVNRNLHKKLIWMFTGRTYSPRTPASEPWLQSSVLKTIILKLDQLGLNTSLCNWLLDMLIKRQQVGRQQHIPHWTEGPHKDVCWGPLLHSAAPPLPTDTQLKPHQVNTRRGDVGSHLRWGWQQRRERGRTSVLDSNLCLILEMEITVDFRRVAPDHQPCHSVESGQDKFLGVHITRHSFLDHQHHRTCQESQLSPLLSPQIGKTERPSPHHVHLLRRHQNNHHVENILQCIMRATEKIICDLISSLCFPVILQHQ